MHGEEEEDWFGAPAQAVALVAAPVADEDEDEDDDEDWFGGSGAGGLDDAAAAALVPQSAAPALVPQAAALTLVPQAAQPAHDAGVIDVEALVIGRRARKRPAAAMQRQLALAQPAPPAELQTGVVKLVRILFGDRRPADTGANLLSSHSGLATHCGIDKCNFLDHFLCIAHSAFAEASDRVTTLMRWILGKTGVHDQVLTQPLLFIRWRKYDETPSKRLQVPVLVSGTVSQAQTVAKHHHAIAHKHPAHPLLLQSFLIS